MLRLWVDPCEIPMQNLIQNTANIQIVRIQILINRLWEERPAALGTPQPRAFGSLNRVDPLNSVSKYYFSAGEFSLYLNYASHWTLTPKSIIIIMQLYMIGRATPSIPNPSPSSPNPALPYTISMIVFCTAENLTEQWKVNEEMEKVSCNLHCIPQTIDSCIHITFYSLLLWGIKLCWRTSHYWKRPQNAGWKC